MSYSPKNRQTGKIGILRRENHAKSHQIGLIPFLVDASSPGVQQKRVENSYIETLFLPGKLHPSFSGTVSLEKPLWNDDYPVFLI